MRLWDIRTRKLVKVLRGHELEVWAVSYSPDGQYVTSACKDGSIQFWNADATVRDDSYASSDVPLRALHFSADGRNLWVLAQDGSVALWDSASLQPRRVLTELGANNIQLALSPDNDWLVASGSDGSLKVWNVRQEEVRTNHTVHSTPAQPLFAPSHRGELVSREWRTGETIVWETRHWTITKRWRMGPGAGTLSPDGQVLAIWGPGGIGMISLWDVASGHKSREFQAHKESVEDLAFSPDGKTLASVCSDGTIKLWDSASGQPRGSLSGHILGVHSVDFSSDGSRLATGSGGKEAIKLWDLATRQDVATLQGSGFLFHPIQFSPDGTALGAIDNRGRLQIWRAASLDGIGAEELVAGRRPAVE